MQTMHRKLPLIDVDKARRDIDKALKSNPQQRAYTLINILKSNRGSTKDNMLLKMIPHRDKTYPICYQAVCTNGLNLKDVPAKYVNELMCVRAIMTTTSMRRQIDIPITEPMKIATVLGHTRVASSYGREAKALRDKYGEGNLEKELDRVIKKLEWVNKIK